MGRIIACPGGYECVIIEDHYHALEGVVDTPYPGSPERKIMADEKTLAEQELDRVHRRVQLFAKSLEEAKEELEHAKSNYDSALEAQAYWNGIVHLERQ